MLAELKRMIDEHKGIFYCRRRSSDDEIKKVEGEIYTCISGPKTFILRPRYWRYKAFL